MVIRFFVSICDDSTMWRKCSLMENLQPFLIVLGIATAAVGFAVILSGFGLVHRLPAKFPKREKLAELALALNQYGHAWQASLKAIAARS